MKYPTYQLVSTTRCICWGPWLAGWLAAAVVQKSCIATEQCAVDQGAGCRWLLSLTLWTRMLATGGLISLTLWTRVLAAAGLLSLTLWTRMLAAGGLLSLTLWTRVLAAGGLLSLTFGKGSTTSPPQPSGGGGGGGGSVGRTVSVYSTSG